MRGNNSLLVFLAFLVALSGSVGAITVDSCGNLSTANVTYDLSNDIVSSGTCLTIGANGIILDCQEYIITGENASGSYGIHAIGKSNVTIKNCNIRDYQYGIYLDSSDSNALENNTLSSNTRWGIILDSSSFNSLTNNTAHSNGYDGILLDTSSDNNTLTKNNASSNVWYGIYLDTSSEFNTLDSNTANSNGRDGIRLTFAGSDTIINNIVNSNIGYGIFLGSSSSNTIYNNYFNNTNNFYLSSSTNAWNTAKTLSTNIISDPYLGGNFWAKPDGTGFSETCGDANGDGICDLEYTLASGNVDYLPLTSYFNASVEPTTVVLSGIVTANATTNYNDATIWVTFTWYSPSQTVGGNSYVQRSLDTTNESGLYRDTYTTPIEDGEGTWTVRAEFKTSDGLLVATRDASFTVVLEAPEFSLLLIPFIASFLIYIHMRKRVGGWEI